MGRPHSNFLKKRADSHCNRQIALKITGLGLFWPEFLYLIVTAYLRSLGFVLSAIPRHEISHLLVPQNLDGRSYIDISFCFRDIPALFAPASTRFPCFLTPSRTHGGSSCRAHVGLSL